MPIPEKDLNEFIEIYERVYGRSISREEALQEAGALLNLFRATLIDD